jgi:hypothetical protein
MFKQSTHDNGLFLYLTMHDLMRDLENSAGAQLHCQVNSITGWLLLRARLDLPNVTFVHLLGQLAELCADDPSPAISALWVASLRIDHESGAIFANRDAGNYF